MLVDRMTAVLPACAARRVRIITNMGAANPLAAVNRRIEILMATDR